MHLIQLVPGATGAVPVLPGTGSIIPPSVPFQWATFQNNGTNPMRIGDASVSSTMGIILSATGSLTFGPEQHAGQDLNEWYVYIVNGDTCDILYQE